MITQSSTGELILKVIVEGVSGVGKTNLITRFCEDRYTSAWNYTIGETIFLV
jgi:GTPase SAR1 family protein